MKMQYPLNRVWLSRGFCPAHPAVDIGWFKEYGQNEEVLAPAAGTVVSAVDGYDNTASTARIYGNYVSIYHGSVDGKPVYTLHAHLKNGSVCVKAGQSVKRGDRIGRMNNSGYSFGSHTQRG